MKQLDGYPKSIKKAIRYIKQDAKRDELHEIKRLIDQAIKLRSLKLD